MTNRSIIGDNWIFRLKWDTHVCVFTSTYVHMYILASWANYARQITRGYVHTHIQLWIYNYVVIFIILCRVSQKFDEDQREEDEKERRETKFKQRAIQPASISNYRNNFPLVITSGWKPWHEILMQVSQLAPCFRKRRLLCQEIRFPFIIPTGRSDSETNAVEHEPWQQREFSTCTVSRHRNDSND